MKRLLTALAIVAAASLASAGMQPVIANPAHHPAQTTKGKKASPAKKTKKVKSSGMSMQCPMMKGHSMKPGMMMHHGRRMKCPMMGSAKHHNMGMTKH
jgi:hypothetical protein